MSKALVRKLIDGAWRWVQEEDAADGGSQPIEVVRVPLAFNTPGLVQTGITVYTPTAGDILLVDSVLCVSASWNGTTPGFSLYSQGDDPADRIVDHYSSLVTDGGEGDHQFILVNTLALMYLNASANQHIYLADSTPLIAMIDDGAAGNPGSTVGAGELVLLIVKAS